MKKTARMALVAGLAALALTACGDRDDSSGSSADDETTSAAPTEATSEAALDAGSGQPGLQGVHGLRLGRIR